MKFTSILDVVILVLLTKYISLPASIILSKLLLLYPMPARPIESICAAAAVVEFVKCPEGKRLIVRPAGDKSKAWLRVNTN